VWVCGNKRYWHYNGKGWDFVPDELGESYQPYSRRLISRLGKPASRMAFWVSAMG
jgi:hypothetical protein